MENVENISVEELAVQMRRNYHNEWRRRNKDKVKVYNHNQWLKRAAAALAEQSGANDERKDDQ